MNTTTTAATIDAPFTAAILHDAPYPGSTYGVAVDGWTFTATVYRDDNQDAPWDAHDGHGDVSEWTTRDKAPGELVLSSDRGSFRYYDFAAACATARRDGWGAPGDEGMTPRQRAAHAARADFNRLRAWCNDEWCWIGVGVTLARQGVELVPEYNHALWGIEGDSGADYLASIANELAADALSDAREKLAELVHDDEA